MGKDPNLLAALKIVVGYADLATAILANPLLDIDKTMSWASLAGHSDLVAKLLQLGANPNYQYVLNDGPWWGKESLSAPHIMGASYREHVDIVEMLLQARADPNLTNAVGETALSKIYVGQRLKPLSGKQKKIVDLLLAAGATEPT